MTREDVLEQIQSKLPTAREETLVEVLLLLQSDDYPMDDFDRRLIADWQAGKLDKTLNEVTQNYQDGNIELLTDGLKRRAKAADEVTDTPKV